MREFQQKLNSGEYVLDYMGYSPSDLGIYYGDCNKLGGEEPFLYLGDFFSGIGDVEWWDNTLLQKLSEEKKSELLTLLKRNVFFKEYVNEYNSRTFNYNNVGFSRLSNLEKIIYIYLNQKINKSQDLFTKMYENDIQCIKEMNIQDSFKEEYSNYIKEKKYQEYEKIADENMCAFSKLLDKDFIEKILNDLSDNKSNSEKE